MKDFREWVCIIACTLGIAANAADMRGLAMFCLVLCVISGCSALVRQRK